MIECQRCGWCCHNVNINISYSDILRWAKEKRFDILNRISYIDHEDVKKKGFYIVNTVTAPKKPCPFLIDDNICSIYETRPRACRDFPQAYTEEKKKTIECSAKNFIIDKKTLFILRRDQALDFRLAEDRKERVIEILRKVRQIGALLTDIKEFGNDPTESLWVDGLGTEKPGWTRVGTTPYLNAQDEPNHYVWTATKKAEIGDFTFANSGVGAGTINSVTLYVYGQTLTGVKRNTFYLWDGAEWTSVGLPTLPTTYGWVSVVVTTILNTWPKIDGAKLYIEHANSTDQSNVDAAYLLVDYAGAVAYTKDFTTDALLLKRQTKDFLTDGILTLIGKKDFTSDALLLVKQTKDFNVDAILRFIQTKDFSIDALLTRAGTQDFDVDALLKLVPIKDFATDGILLKRQTKDFSVDAILTQVQTKDFTLDALLLKRQIKDFSTDAILLKAQTKPFTTDGILLQRQTKTFTVDALLFVRQTKTFLTDAMLLKRQTKQFTSDAILTNVYTKTFLLDAILLKAQVKTFSCDAILESAVPPPPEVGDKSPVQFPSLSVSVR